MAVGKSRSTTLRPISHTLINFVHVLDADIAYVTHVSGQGGFLTETTSACNKVGKIGRAWPLGRPEPRKDALD